MPYPTEIDSYTPVQGTSLVAASDHAAMHNAVGSAVVNIQTKMGIQASTPTVNDIFVGLGNGTSTWSKTWNGGTLGTATLINATLGTPLITAGTINTTILGTPTLTLGSDAHGDIYYRSSGGTITRLAPGTTGQFLKTNGAAANPSWATPTTSVPGTTATTGGDFTTAATSLTDVTGGSVTVVLQSTSNVFLAATFKCQSDSGTVNYTLGLKKGTATLISCVVDPAHQSISDTRSIVYLDTSVVAGTYTYQLGALAQAGGTTRVLGGSFLAAITM